MLYQMQKAIGPYLHTCSRVYKNREGSINQFHLSIQKFKVPSISNVHWRGHGLKSWTRTRTEYIDPILSLNPIQGCLKTMLSINKLKVESKTLKFCSVLTTHTLLLMYLLTAWFYIPTPQWTTHFIHGLDSIRPKIKVLVSVLIPRKQKQKYQSWSLFHETQNESLVSVFNSKSWSRPSLVQLFSPSPLQWFPSIFHLSKSMWVHQNTIGPQKGCFRP